MRIAEKLGKTEKTLFSLEVIPPLKGQGIDSIFEAIDPLMEFNPICIDVTYHREEYAFKKMPDGLLKRYSVRKRPGTVGITAAIMNRYKVEVVPHLICGGFSREETENALIDLDFLGVCNVLALRGDSVKSEREFTPEEDGNDYAVDLIKQIADMNSGRYLHDELTNANSTEFCIGIAGYPEKHFEAPNLIYDLRYTKMKIEAGAEYIVTQMFFDNKVYFDYVRECRNMGITVPIVPGIKLLASMRHLKLIPSIFHARIPETLSQEVEKCRDAKQVREVGIEWAIQQGKELAAAGVPCLHFYTMGKTHGTRRVAEAIL